MLETDPFFLPDDVREGLARARARDRRSTGGRLRVQMGDDWYPITAYDDAGFEVSFDVAPKLRGLVEIFEGPKLVRSVLIVAGGPSGDAMRYEFKRATAPRTSAALDYEREIETPAGYIGST